MMAELVQASGGPMVHDLRAMTDAVFYVVKNGVEWRALPVDFPPWEAAYVFFDRWSARSLPEQLTHRLRAELRARQGRTAKPTAAIVDPRWSRPPAPSARPAAGPRREESGSGPRRVPRPAGAAAGRGPDHPAGPAARLTASRRRRRGGRGRRRRCVPGGWVWGAAGVPGSGSGCGCACRKPRPSHATRRYSLIRPPERVCLDAVPECWAVPKTATSKPWTSSRGAKNVLSSLG